METANTDNNVAATPSQNDNPTIESLAQALVSAIVAKVQEGIEPVDQSIHELVEEVVESNDFENRVNELAYSQAEDFFCDTDLSDKVEECLEYRDWDETVGSLIEGYVDGAIEDLPERFASKDYVAALETTLEERIEAIEGQAGYDGKLGSDIRLLGQISVDLMTHETRVCDLEAFERRTMERLESIEERLTELEQVTSSKFGQLDNIQIAFRGIVETMFAR
jgi:hypothetical protein